MKASNLSRLLLSGFCLLCLLLFCGCAKKVALSGADVKDDAQSITAVVTPEDLTLLDGFESLVSADFSGSTCYADLMDWAKQHPLVEVRYTVDFPGGVTAENTASSLDLISGSDTISINGTPDLLKSTNVPPPNSS